MDKFAMIVKFTAKADERDKLAGLLLEASAEAEHSKDCESYIVHIAENEPDVIWVTEVWSHPEAHAASLTEPATQAMIQRAMPYIAGVEGTKLKPLGGKGLL